MKYPAQTNRVSQGGLPSKSYPSTAGSKGNQNTVHNSTGTRNCTGSSSSTGHKNSQLGASARLRDTIDLHFTLAKAAVFFCCLLLGATPSLLCWQLGILRPDLAFFILFSSMILTLVLYFSLGCFVLRNIVPDYLMRLKLGCRGHAGETAIMAAVCNVLVHSVTLLIMGIDPLRVALIFASAVFFTYPVYYLATLLWGLQTEVRAVIRGELYLNTDYFANVVRRVRTAKEYLPITISLPVHTESNEVIFATIRNCQHAVAEYQHTTGQKANLIVSDDGLAKLLGGSVCTSRIEACLTQLPPWETSLMQNIQQNGTAPVSQDAPQASSQQASSQQASSQQKPSPAMLQQAAERIVFYRKNGISFVARPVAGRKGKFKKGGNLNFTGKLASQLAAGAEQQALFAADGPLANGYAEGEILLHDLICLLDKDSGLEPGVLAATAPEFAADASLAFTQHTTRGTSGNTNTNTNICGNFTGSNFNTSPNSNPNAGGNTNASGNYFSWLQGRFTSMVYQVALPVKALQGLQVHLMGHSAFLRRSFLEATGGWAEDRVSEDYAKSLDAYSTGWHGKYLAFRGLEFSEQVASSFVEESEKQLRYCYGISEVVLGGRYKLTAPQIADMLIYYLSYFNLAAALPVIVLLLVTHQIYYLFAGMLVSGVLFLALPVVQGCLLGAPAGFAGRAHTVRYFVLTALAYLGYTYSMLRGFVCFFADRFRGSYKTFQATSVDTLDHSFAVGLSLIRSYARQNLPVLAAWTLIALGCVTLLQDAPFHVIRPLVAVFLLAHLMAPVVLTPQLFARPRLNQLKQLSKLSRPKALKHVSQRAFSLITHLLH